ncbi:MAG TPA: hypothetical protein VF026_26215 [Ktedonobacteraceae bacterium]
MTRLTTAVANPITTQKSEPFQDVEGRFLFDALSHHALGHGILSMLDEEVGQSKECKIVNTLFILPAQPFLL